MEARTDPRVPRSPPLERIEGLGVSEKGVGFENKWESRRYI